MTKYIKGHAKYITFMSIMLIIIVSLNVLAWNSSVFADWHRENVYIYIQAVMSKVSNIFPFSIGEVMLAAAVLFVVATVGMIIAGIISRIYCVEHKFIGRFLRAAGVVFMGVALLMTENCFILYHSSGITGKYLGGASDTHTFEELANVRDFIVAKANELSKLVERDEDGRPVYGGDDMAAEAVRSMQKLGEYWDDFEGEYSIPKNLYASEFMCQQSMRGYYFPFTMEANINSLMTEVNKPSAMCHELAHTKGFMEEDEANFIAYLACIYSDDVFFQYSGYLSVLNYINNEFSDACGSNSLYSSYAKVSSQVREDNVFITDDTEEKVERKAVIPTKAVKKAAATFINTNLIANGIPEGAVSYTGVVGLLLTWYDDGSIEMLAQAG